MACRGAWWLRCSGFVVGLFGSGFFSATRRSPQREVLCGQDFREVFAELADRAGGCPLVAGTLRRGDPMQRSFLLIHGLGAIVEFAFMVGPSWDWPGPRLATPARPSGGSWA